MRTPRCTALLLMGVALAAAPSVHALSDNEARKAILELRQQLASQQRETAALAAQLRDITEQNIRVRLQLADQIERLQRDIVQLRGDIEQATRPQAGAAAARTPTTAANTADPQEQAAYDGAIDLYRNGQYQAASESLSAFLLLYPNSTLAATAHFYLGSSRYASKDYAGAIAQLETLVAQYPQSARTPDALLVIAGSQFELNDRAAARVTLQRIVTDYANTPAAETAARRLELL